MSVSVSGAVVGTLISGTGSGFSSTTAEYRVYQVSAGISYTDSVDACVERGGYLATFPSTAAYNRFVALYPTSPNLDVWIGGTDVDGNDRWRWSSKGSPFETEEGGKGRTFYQSGACLSGYYCTWKSGFPNNVGGNEPYLHWAMGTLGNNWNDDNDDEHKAGYVCQFTVWTLVTGTGPRWIDERRSEYAIYLNPMTTHAVAQAKCTSEGRYVGMLPDSRAFSHFRLNYPADLGLTSRIWLGASDTAEEGVWRWNAQGSPLAEHEGGLGKTFSQGSSCKSGSVCLWGNNQPDDYSIGEDHLEYNFNNAYWNDLHELKLIAGVLCQRTVTDTKTQTLTISQTDTKTISTTVTPPPTPTPTATFSPSSTVPTSSRSFSPTLSFSSSLSQSQPTESSTQSMTLTSSPTQSLPETETPSFSASSTDRTRTPSVSATVTLSSSRSSSDQTRTPSVSPTATLSSSRSSSDQTRTPSVSPTKTLSLSRSSSDQTHSQTASTGTVTLSTSDSATLTRSESARTVTTSLSPSRSESEGTKTSTLSESQSVSRSKLPPLPLGECPWSIFRVVASYYQQQEASSSTGSSVVPTNRKVDVVTSGELLLHERQVVQAPVVLALINTSHPSHNHSEPFPTSPNGTLLFYSPEAEYRASLPRNWRLYTDRTLAVNKTYVPHYTINVALLRSKNRPRLTFSWTPKSCQRFLNSALEGASVNLTEAPTFLELNEKVWKESNHTERLFRWFLSSLKEVRVGLTTHIPENVHLAGRERIVFSLPATGLEGGFNSSDYHRIVVDIETDRSWIPPELAKNNRLGIAVVAVGASLSGSGATINAAQRNRLLNPAANCPSDMSEFDWELLDDLLEFRLEGIEEPFDVPVGVALGNGMLVVATVIANFLWGVLVYFLRRARGAPADGFTLWDALGRVRFPGRGFTVGLVFMPAIMIACLMVLLHANLVPGRREVPFEIMAVIAIEFVLTVFFFLFLPTYVILSSKFALSVAEVLEPKHEWEEHNLFIRFITPPVDWCDTDGTTVRSERIAVAAREQRNRTGCCGGSKKRKGKRGVASATEAQAQPHAYGRVTRHCGHFYDDCVSGAKEFLQLETLSTMAASSIFAAFPTTKNHCEWSFIIIIVLLLCVFLTSLITRPYGSASMNLLMVTAYFLQLASSVLLWRAYIDGEQKYADYATYAALAATVLMILLLVVSIGQLVVSFVKDLLRRARRRLKDAGDAVAENQLLLGVFGVEYQQLK